MSIRSDERHADSKPTWLMTPREAHVLKARRTSPDLSVTAPNSRMIIPSCLPPDGPIFAAAIASDTSAEARGLARHSLPGYIVDPERKDP